MSRVILFCLAIGLSLSLSSCLEDKCLATRQYTVFTPIYAKMEEHRREVQAESPRVLRNTGALYMYGDYIFINEKKEGIHIVDAELHLGYNRLTGYSEWTVVDNVRYRTYRSRHTPPV